MPSASEEDRDLMRKWFGSIDDYGPRQLLKSHGFFLTEGWEWVLPTLTHRVSEIELACMWFLMDEWDYGGLAEIITHVAVHDAFDKLWILPRPKRHFHVIRNIADHVGWKAGDPPVAGHPEGQGFITTRNRFVDRSTAYEIAKAAGQLLDGVGRPPHLFSEDVW